MLSKNYQNALTGLKAQGSATSLFAGCDAEVDHIYRIVMTEGIPVNMLDESTLLNFIEKERAGHADYTKYTDRDGLKYADLEQEVEIYPAIMKGATSHPIDGQSYTLSSDDAKEMLVQLIQMGRLTLITSTMQGLAQRVDGTKLQTAFPHLQEVKTCISKGLSLPEPLIEKLNTWESQGATEVNFDFVEKTS